MQMKYAPFKQEAVSTTCRNSSSPIFKKRVWKHPRRPVLWLKCYHGSAEMFCENRLLYAFCKDHPVVWSQTRPVGRSTYFSILLCLLAQLPLNQESQHVADKNSDMGKKQTRLGLGLEFTLEVPVSTSSSNPTTHSTHLA